MHYTKHTENHLEADEAEQESKAVAEEPELILDATQEEKQGTESHDGKDVGEIDDVGIGSNGEYSRNAVDCKNDVAELDDEQYDEEGCNIALAINTGKEIVSVGGVADPEILGTELDDGMILGIDTFIVAFEHLVCAIEKNDPENGQDPLGLGNKSTESKDEEETHDDGSENAPEEDAVIILPVDTEGDENHDHDKDIVDGETLLKEISGKILREELLAVELEIGLKTVGSIEHPRHIDIGIGNKLIKIGNTVNPFGMQTDDESKSHGKRNPDTGPQAGLLDANLMIFLVKHTQIKSEHE